MGTVAVVTARRRRRPCDRRLAREGTLMSSSSTSTVEAREPVLPAMLWIWTLGIYFVQRT